MINVLKSDNLIILYAKHFLFFEWTLQESDLRHTLRSPEFNMGDEKSSYLEFGEPSSAYMHLHNPKSVENGRYALVVFDVTDSPILTKTRLIGPAINSNKIDLFGELSLPSSSKFPIIISCTAKVSNIDLQTNSITVYGERMRELCTDFKTILEQEINTDIVLKVDKEIIKVHKSVLVARSPVFRKMFSHDSSEAAENTVVIPDIKSTTMRKLVSFLYTAEMEKCGFDEALELYYASDKYEVLSLRDGCKTELLNNLKESNACFLFTLASRHNDEDLKEKIIQFVIANFKSVVNMNNLNDMNKEDIILLMSLCVPHIKCI